MQSGGADQGREVPVGDKPSAEAVAAVVVTFHPDAQLAERLGPLIGQVGAIVIVDNGSSPEELSPVLPLVQGGMVSTILNGTNLGIATALNQGAAWAAERGYRWFLTLDQDTLPGPTLVLEAARVFDAFHISAPAVIGASWTGHSCEEEPGRPERVVITSGAVYAVGPWLALGRFREDFFIDYVDVEYCLRARQSGYAVLKACRPTIEHEIGHPRVLRTPFRSVTPSNHSPIRRYYITRNRVRVWRLYWRRERSYVAFDMRAAARELVKLVLYETRRRAKLRAVVRGAMDGIRGVAGPAPISMT
jgi:rhamnosyltransferase